MKSFLNRQRDADSASLLESLRAANLSDDQPYAAALEKVNGFVAQERETERQIGDLDRRLQRFRDLLKLDTRAEALLTGDAPANREQEENLRKELGGLNEQLPVIRRAREKADAELAAAAIDASGVILRRLMPAIVDFAKRRADTYRAVCDSDALATEIHAVLEVKGFRWTGLIPPELLVSNTRMSVIINALRDAGIEV